jgi:hypothetical protein
MEMVTLRLQLLYPEFFYFPSVSSSPEASTVSAAPFSDGANKVLTYFCSFPLTVT